jgi:chromosomal replication initiation ATPase DnaA
MSAVEWVLQRLSPEELQQLAYELSRIYPIEARRGAKDAEGKRTYIPQIDTVIDVIARFYRVLPSQIYDQDRSKRVSEARKAVFEVLRHGLDMSLDQIGDVMGNRDHTTVIYGLKTLNRETDKFRESIAILMEMGVPYAHA